MALTVDQAAGQCLFVCMANCVFDNLCDSPASWLHLLVAVKDIQESPAVAGLVALISQAMLRQQAMLCCFAWETIETIIRSTANLYLRFLKSLLEHSFYVVCIAQYFCRILIYYDGVEMAFDMQDGLPHFKGHKKGRVYLTTHRVSQLHSTHYDASFTADLLKSFL